MEHYRLPKMDWFWSTDVYFFVSLGSNIEPVRHIGQTLDTLAKHFGPLISFPVVHTPPCDIESDNDFLNGLVLFYSELTEAQVKTQFNELEERSGRDRSDPARSEKDRTLDLDILAVQDKLDLSVCRSFDEPYTQQCVQAAGLFEGKAPPCANITVAGYSLGQRAAAIYRNHAGSDILVVEDTVDSLLQRFKSTFHSQ